MGRVERLTGPYTHNLVGALHQGGAVGHDDAGERFNNLKPA